MDPGERGGLNMYGVWREREREREIEEPVFFFL
jgi:hypothetical protein